MDGWVYKKNNITTVMEIMQDRFVLCPVVSCAVLYHVVCVLQGPDAKPGDHRAPLSTRLSGLKVAKLVVPQTGIRFFF